MKQSKTDQWNGPKQANVIIRKCNPNSMKEYRHRLIDEELRLNLESFGAVSLEGPKWCGKTTTALQQAKSTVFMQDEDNAPNYLRLAEDTPSALLKGDRPHLIDEWQVAPRLWDAVRFSVDKDDEEGMYILTSSRTMDWDKVKHSGTGRISRLRIRTMSLWESGDSTGEVRLGSLFTEGTRVGGSSPHEIYDIAEILTRGGWPKVVGRDSRHARTVVEGYCRSITESEIRTVDGRERDPDKMRDVLKSISRNTATHSPDTKILADINPNAPAMNIKTLRDYIGVLERIHVVEDLPAWSPKLRSKATIMSRHTRHLTDPAIAAYFLGATDEDLVFDMDIFGLLFESLVIRDLRVYTQALGGDVYHFRDSNGVEADAIVHLNNGRWGAIEVKLNPAREDEGAESLIRLRDTVDCRPPSFLAVITGRGMAHTRPDGIHVIPIGCLRE